MKEGWKSRPLGEVCSFLNRGISPKYLDAGGICVLNQRCVREHRINFEPSRRHDGRAKTVGSERLVRVGDVLVNSTGTGTLGRVAQVREEPPEPTTVDSHLTIVRPVAGKFYPEFFGYMLMGIEDAIKEAGEGCGGQTELSRSVLAEKFLVHYPESVTTQRRIVGILDEAFDGIAIAKANAEKSIQNARALYAGHFETVFGNCSGWKMVRLGALTELARGHNPPKEKFCREPKPGYVRFYQIRDGGCDDHAVYVPDTPQLHRMKADDIMMVAYRHIGRVFRGVEGAFNVALCKISNSRRDLLDDEYLFQIIPSRFVKGELLKRSERSLIPSMSIEDLREVLIPLPPVAEQRRIVGCANEFSAETQRLESLCRQKLAALETLKKSLLHQVFSGEL